MDWTAVLRWFHILAGAAWFGELAVVNFVLVPALNSLGAEERAGFARAAFPRVFTLASWLSAIAVVTGFVLLGERLDWVNWDLLLEGRWGRSVLVGASLGFGLTLFHHIVERRLSPSLEGVGNPGNPGFVYFERRLRLIPRVAILVLLVVMGTMMYAARGV